LEVFKLKFPTMNLGDNTLPMEKLPCAWLEQIQVSIHLPPSTPRLPLLWAGHPVGSVDAEAFAAFVAQAGVSDAVRFAPAFPSGVNSWHLLGSPDEALLRLADAMRQIDYAQVALFWRNEQLAVHGVSGEPLATVERGAVRALGISTHGVHLHGYTANDSIWIQQRALNKKTDPGRWDTLMGGMVSAGDSLERALERETMEEAGLRLEQVQDLQHVGSFTMRAPNAPDNGLGYVVERIDWFECLVPDDVKPVNIDGEVQQFKLVSQEALCRMLLDGAFTTEASVILGQWMSARWS
jgi:8-oxo-dGTP pyrophosphatase MutT (NUDIX family)